MRMVSCVPGDAVSVSTVPDFVTVAGPIAKAGPAESTTAATAVAATAAALSAGRRMLRDMGPPRVGCTRRSRARRAPGSRSVAYGSLTPRSRGTSISTGPTSVSTLLER
jgi:hypothetical protein